MLGETRKEVIQTSVKLHTVSKLIRLRTNEDKTKYLMISKNNSNVNDLLINSMRFKAENNFK